MTSYKCQEHDGMLAQKGCSCCETSLYIRRLERVYEAAREYQSWIPNMEHIGAAKCSAQLRKAIAALDSIGDGE